MQALSNIFSIYFAIYRTVYSFLLFWFYLAAAVRYTWALTSMRSTRSSHRAPVLQVRFIHDMFFSFSVPFGGVHDALSTSRCPMKGVSRSCFLFDHSSVQSKTFLIECFRVLQRFICHFICHSQHIGRASIIENDQFFTNYVIIELMVSLLNSG